MNRFNFYLDHSSSWVERGHQGAGVKLEAERLASPLTIMKARKEGG